MPALVKANSKLSSGGMQLTAYSIVAQSDNSLGINADFVCLTRFDSAIASTLRVGAPMPVALLQEDNFVALLNNLRATTSPNVQSCNIERNYGLTTFRLSLGVDNEATIGGGGGGGGNTPTIGGGGGGGGNTPTVTGEVTTSTDLRSLTGSVTQTVAGDPPVTKNFSFSFDYYAKTITTEGTGVSASDFAQPSNIFNVRGNINPSRFIAPQIITTSRSYRNNLGRVKNSTTVSAVYIQTGYRI
jgi:hypothetical protein